MGRPSRPARSILVPVVAILAFASCSEADALDGTSWQAVNLGPRPTVPDVVSTATFSDGEVSGTGGCNTYSGAYTIDGGRISITGVGGTELACEELVMAQEAAFYDALTTAERYRVVTDRLELLADEDVVVAFVRRGD